VHRLHPNEFNRDANPWDGVTVRRRVSKKKKPAVSGDQVYQFA
jgi:hypothetical protein